MGAGPSGALLEGDATPHIGSFLTGSQARAALSALRLEQHSRDTVFEALSECCRSRALAWVAEAEATAGLRIQREARELHEKLEHAVKASQRKGLAARQTYFEIQREVCELCGCRPSCIHEPCVRCRRRPLEPLSKLVELCCTCSGGLVTRESCEPQLQRMAAAAEAWATHPLSGAGVTGHVTVRLPSELGQECGGRLFRRELLQAAEERFWGLVARARALHVREPAFVWQSVGRLDRTAALSLHLCSLFSDSHAEAHASVPDTFYSRLCREALAPARLRWQEAPVGDELEFFVREEQLLGMLDRALRLLEKLSRLRPRRVIGAFNAKRKLARPLLHLDVAALVLCGTPVTDPAAKLPRRFVNEARRAAVEVLGLPALHQCEEVARSWANTLDKDRMTAQFAATARAELVCKSHVGFTVAEVLCGDPQAASQWPLSKVVEPHPDALRDLVQATVQADLGRVAGAESLKRRLVELPQEGWDVLTSESDEGSDAAAAPLPRRKGWKWKAEFRPEVRRPGKRRRKKASNKRKAQVENVSFNAKAAKAGAASASAAADAPRVLTAADL